MGGIHAGIQSLHATSAMWHKYTSFMTKNPLVSKTELNSEMKKLNMLREWEEKHQTAILLNGGDSSKLLELVTMLKKSENSFPWCQFHESKKALNGALTAVAIILPEEMYRIDEFDFSITNWPQWEQTFTRWRRNCSTAR